MKTNHKYNVRVSTVEAEIEFAIEHSTTSKQLFDQVIKTLGLREVWYFALQYTDSKGFKTWLKLNQKIFSQDIMKENPLHFTFCIKFYPESIAEELIQSVTIRQFYLQIREAILRGLYDGMFCPAETAVLLASYSCQVKMGDYDENEMKDGFLAEERLLPSRILEQYSLTRVEWEEKVIKWYKELRGLMQEDAMLQYLKIAQNLEMYGVNYYEITNKKGTSLYLGVDALGLYVYEHNNRLNPKIEFQWCEILNLSYRNRKFIIKPIDKKAPNFMFWVQNKRINKCILSICIGNHELYIRRRHADSVEIQQMKVQAAADKEIRRREATRLMNERLARENAEKQKQNLEEKLEFFEIQNKNYEIEKQRYQNRMLELEKKLREEEMRLKEIEEAKRRADQISYRLKQDTNIALDERKKLKIENEEISKLIVAKENDSKRVNNEVYKMREELETSKKKQQNLEQRFHQPDGIISNKDEILTKGPPQNEEIQHQLINLYEEFRVSRKESKFVAEDKIHDENLRQGIDKFKTLTQIRQGNTKKRVEEFETM